MYLYINTYIIALSIHIKRLVVTLISDAINKKNQQKEKVRISVRHYICHCWE